jgi:glutathione S-transferase
MVSDVHANVCRYGVAYPALYASSENCKSEAASTQFNCVQRGHQNCLENQPGFLAMLIVAGLRVRVNAMNLLIVLRL